MSMPSSRYCTWVCCSSFSLSVLVADSFDSAGPKRYEALVDFLTEARDSGKPAEDVEDAKKPEREEL